MQEILFGEQEGKANPSVSCQEMVAGWVDAVRARSGFPPPRQTIGRMARVVKDLLETHPPDLVVATLEVAAVEGKPPAAVPDLMLRVQTQGKVETVRDWVRQHGWPTGTRFKRGPSGGNYVPDPLGYDRAPYRVPWSAPTRDELRIALEALRASGKGETPGGA